MIYVNKERGTAIFTRDIEGKQPFSGGLLTIERPEGYEKFNSGGSTAFVSETGHVTFNAESGDDKIGWWICRRNLDEVREWLRQHSDLSQDVTVYQIDSQSEVLCLHLPLDHKDPFLLGCGQRLGPAT